MKTTNLLAVLSLFLMFHGSVLNGMHPLKQKAILFKRLHGCIVPGLLHLEYFQQRFTLDTIFQIHEQKGLPELKKVYWACETYQKRYFLELVYGYINAKYGDNCTIANELKKLVDEIDPQH